MAYLFAPQPSDPDLPIFFNVNGVVGAGPAQNLREDVLLVQFAFEQIAKSPKPTTGQAVVAAAKAVRATGTVDQATIQAISAFQKASGNPNQITDGRVSPAKGGYNYGGAYWTIASLNNSIQDRNVDVWPRIDKIPGCPGELVQMVTRTVAGK